ncbi:hypothetical protein HG535_0F00580 [Zygotorulaspora mrakii]|uniref:Uncharacterized protein n=1 Tax=Zygotorulaspora mrakii TaxID=42260 RepID=A0A7H9B4D3_ZYGMR|nr:uncharacterized protein HG535_0F00580 [Zygotorulaspora mrakii]QLG73548.1 hypothetical protein HG535_0F00580 [Zygotorulaspora mrakii]
MVSQEEFKSILQASCRFLNQNDLTSLALTSKSVCHSIAVQQLYHSISITRDPVIRSNECLLDAGRTYVSGYRALKKTDDQNDLFLYDRIERLMESSKLQHVKEIDIQDSLFSDEECGNLLIRKFLDRVIELDKIESIDIRNDHLFLEHYPNILGLTNLKKIKIVDTDALSKIRSFSKLKKIEWIVEQPRLTKQLLTPHVVDFFNKRIEACEFIVDNINSSSFQIIQFFYENGIQCENLRSLKFNHLYGINVHSEHHKDASLKWLKDVVCLEKLKTLELGISSENIDHDLIDDFLEELAPHLKSLRNLALIETTPEQNSDCTLKEVWDLTINRFILRIPDIGLNLHTLSISHKTPLNGLCSSAVQGNYTRRRVLYETVLPKLTSLRNLIAPNMLQSLSVYEVLACDILWNGCECSYCKKVLPVFDEYIMNHQYYSRYNGRYMDIIPTVFFSYAGDYLSRRFNNRVEWDTKVFDTAPLYRCWNFRGYEQIHHFDNYEDLFDESAFGPLCKVISHFFNGYMDYLVKFLPNLEMAMFSGIYYTIDKEANTYECIYD